MSASCHTGKPSLSPAVSGTGRSYPCSVRDRLSLSLQSPGQAVPIPAVSGLGRSGDCSVPRHPIPGGL